VRALIFYYQVRLAAGLCRQPSKLLWLAGCGPWSHTSCSPTNAATRGAAHLEPRDDAGDAAAVLGPDPAGVQLQLSLHLMDEVLVLVAQLHDPDARICGEGAA